MKLELAPLEGFFVVPGRHNTFYILKFNIFGVKIHFTIYLYPLLQQGHCEQDVG